MTGKKRGKGREARRAALKARQEAERERERDELHAPRVVQIPTKLVRAGPLVEVQADVTDEHFGGFAEEDARRPSGGIGGQVIKTWFIGITGFGGWEDIDGDRGGVEVIWPTPKGSSTPVRRVLDSRRKIAWQRKPAQWAAQQATSGAWPFLLREEWEARGFKLARQRGTEPERDYYHRRDPLASFSGALPTMYKPKREVGARFKRVKLPRIDIKLFPRVPVDRAAMRTELEPLVAEYLAAGKSIDTCPAETTTTMLNRRRPGRQIKGERKMTNAERQRNWYWRRREKAKLIKASPPAGGEQGRGHDIGKYQGHPRGLDSESHSDAKSETAG